MERVQSLTVPAPGGVGRSEGSGWNTLGRVVAVVACATTALAGVGCVTAGKATNSFKAAIGLGPAKPATQLIATFHPRIEYLPDPTQDASRRPGLVGQMFLFAADGKFATVDGDLTVFAEDVTPRPAGMPKAISEAWHFDKLTLRKLKGSDERFGDQYTLFLPYPPNWKDVTQVNISCKYEPKPEPGATAGPTLHNNPQTMVLDFTTPGTPVWTKLPNGGSKPTAPAELTAIPDVGKAIAQGKTGAATLGPQPALNPAAQQAAATTPHLPPPTHFDGTKPVHVAAGANGSQVSTTAVALPPGQTLPPGWTMNQNREMVPPPGTNPWTVTPPPANTMPAPNTVAPPPSTSLPPAGGMNTPGPMAPIGLPSSPPMSSPAGGFDPNSPVGPWSNGMTGPNTPGASAPLPQIPLTPGGSGTVTIPRR